MQSTDSLIQDYLAALRILDLEGLSVLGHDASVAYRRRILQRVAQLDKHSSQPAPGHAPNKKPWMHQAHQPIRGAPCASLRSVMPSPGPRVVAPFRCAPLRAESRCRPSAAVVPWR